MSTLMCVVTDRRHRHPLSLPFTLSPPSLSYLHSSPPNISPLPPPQCGTTQKAAKAEPSSTLFVVGFDPDQTRTKHLEEIFCPFGETSRVEIKRNFAFVEYKSLEASGVCVCVLVFSFLKEQDKERGGCFARFAWFASLCLFGMR